MFEIRLHGRGGMGTVKAAEVIVHAQVAGGGFGNSIPFFGFERQGAPVASFVRLDDRPIRPKTQVYSPHCVIVLDATLGAAVDLFEGMREDSILVVNSAEAPGAILVPDRVRTVAAVDATGLSMKRLGRSIPNTVMLGAFVRGTGRVDLELVAARVATLWGDVNAELVREAYAATRIFVR